MYLTYHKKHPPKKKKRPPFSSPKSHPEKPPPARAWSSVAASYSGLEPGKRWVFFPSRLKNICACQIGAFPQGGQNPKCLEITTWNIMSTDNFVTLRASPFGLPNPTSTPSLPTPLQQLFRLAVRLHPLRQGLGAQLKNCMGSEKFHGNIFKVEEKTSIKHHFFREGKITNHFGKEKNTPQRSMKLADGLHFVDC